MPIDPFVLPGLPERVVFGRGSVEQVPCEVEGLGLERVLLVVSPANAGVGDRLEGRLGPRSVHRLGEVREHVPEPLAAAARAAAVTAHADGIVSVGGGSATGLAKAVALDLDLPIVAVPTTYAGSELTDVYGITGTTKRTGRDRRVVPRIVVYDPELTRSLAPAVAAASGCNALAHAVEAVYAPAANPVASLFAEEAVAVLAEALPQVVDGAGAEAHERALYGAFLAGAAMAGAGVALHHKLCHVLGGRHALPHGQLHAVLLPHVVAYNEVATDRLAGVAAALGSVRAASALHTLGARLGAPPSLAALGLPGTALAAAADEAAGAVGDSNPRPVTASDLLLLLEDAHAGRPPRTWAP